MLSEILRDTAKKYPDKRAFVYDQLTVTYKELLSAVVGLSNGLQSLGIKKGDCIALILPNCPEFIISFYAIAHMHSIVLLVNPALAEEEIKYYLEDSKATVIITDIQRSGICRSLTAGLKRKISLILIDSADPSEILFKDLIKDRASHDMHDVFEGDVAYQYSSGSTGRPKRVCKTHMQLYHEAHNFHLTLNTSSDDNILCVVPLFHAHGLGNCMLAAIYAGATIVILENVMKKGLPVAVPFIFRRERVLELICKENITILPGVPFVYSALADMPEDYHSDLTSLRICFSAGNFLPKETFDKFRQRFGIPIRQLYGCTEVGSFSINLENISELHYDSVGMPMKNNEVKIVDETGNVVPAGTIGELCIKSGALTKGYDNMPELNKEAFKDGYFLTGDLGKLDDKGSIYITGRKKIFIEVGGNKVDPLEVEDVLATHPKIREVVIVGIKGPFGGEMIKAVIVLSENVMEKEIISFCRNKIASYKVPEVIEFREEIPKSPLGKILRKDLI